MTIKLPQLVLENPFGVVTLPERMVWTSSSVKMFRKCKRKWFWKYIMRLRPRYRAPSLMIGSAFHHTLGEWYTGPRVSMAKIVGNHVKVMEKEAAENHSFYDQEEYDKLTTAIDTFTGMMLGYAEVYDSDRKDWVINRETIEAQFKVDMGTFDYAGMIDLVAVKRNSKTYFQVEHKTASKIEESYIDRLPLDTQVRGYVYGAIKAKGLKINEVLYDVVRKCKLRRKSNETMDQFSARIRDDYMSDPTKYFFREPLKFAKSDLDAFSFEIYQTHAEYMAIVEGGYARDIAKVFGVESMDVVYAGKILHPTNPRAWPLNDATCNDFFRLCEFHPLCTKGLDRGTGMFYAQGDDLNEELAEAD